MKKLIMMSAAVAMTVFLSGCGGAPSPKEFEAKLREYNKKIDMQMTEDLISMSVEIYKGSKEDVRQKIYDELVQKESALK